MAGGSMDSRELPYVVKVPRSEYVQYCDDLLRIATIQAMLQFMFMLRGSSGFDAEFLELVLYILAGVSMYWLVVKRVLKFAVRPERVR
jgi:hypothetical protein